MNTEDFALIRDWFRARANVATSPTEALDAVAHYLDEIRAIELADRELELADADLDTDERARVLDVHRDLWEDRRREFLARVRIWFIPG